MEITLNAWTSRTGQNRRYINNYAPLLGLDVERYKTGNVSYATLDGEKLSNSRASQMLNAKVWLDDDDAVHVDYWSAHRTMTAGEAIERITAALREQGII